jgi:hypothetical protein
MENRPWLLISAPIALGSIGVGFYLNAISRGHPMKVETELHVAYAFWAFAALWVVVVFGCWVWRKLFNQRPSQPGAPTVDHVRCTRCGETVPCWFTERIAQTGETICLKHIDGMPYPLPAETEDDFVARWTRDGKPRADP